MAEISQSVELNYLSAYKQAREILKPFLLNGFNVTWARIMHTHNTELHMFFLSPEDHIQESYGFDSEVVMAYSPYSTLEPRVIQSVEFNMDSFPAKGRVDKLTYFLVSADTSVEEWTKNYRSQNSDSRLIIPICVHDLYINVANPWYIRNILGRYFFGRDLFENTLPLTKDEYFFGRQQICANYYDAIKRSENKGLFGLRKTGKTSLLFKLRRMIELDEWGFAIYIDCKLPQVRNLHWKELLKHICIQIGKEMFFPKSRLSFEKEGDELFYDIFHSADVEESKKHIVLFFDEIEYISYFAKLNKHWETEYIDFWQTLWSIQSETKKFSFVITGVNPNVVEESIVSGVQNPLFGIVGFEYLKGFDFDECKLMISKLGKRMGLDFEYEGIKYIYDRYGGHPLLTRMACSLANKKVQFLKISRPYNIASKFLNDDQSERESELTYYCGHVVSELREFYIDEYEMLELLATGMVADFNELSESTAFIKHLSAYGLVTKDANGLPVIAIPVLGTYIAKEIARKKKSKTLLRLVPESDRALWLERRKDLILQDMKVWERLIDVEGKPCLYGCNSFGEADQFARIRLCSNPMGYQNFINTMFKCFYESIENYGKSIGKKKYIREEIKDNYPAFYSLLDRINAYRNEQDHLLLLNIVTVKVKDYLDEDLLGQAISSIPDPYFALQQRILDYMIASIQIEISALS